MNNMKACFLVGAAFVFAVLFPDDIERTPDEHRDDQREQNTYDQVDAHSL